MNVPYCVGITVFPFSLCHSPTSALCTPLTVIPCQPLNNSELTCSPAPLTFQPHSVITHPVAIPSLCQQSSVVLPNVSVRSRPEYLDDLDFTIADFAILIPMVKKPCRSGCPKCM